MSYTSIPNQPLIFNNTLPEQCEGCNSGYAQLVDFNDQLFAQFECSTCGTPMFSDGEAVFVAGCTTNGFNVTKTTTNQTWVAYWEFAQYMQYDVIKVVVQVDSIQGVLIVQDQYSQFQVTTTGTHTFYFLNNYFNVPTYTIGFGGTNAVEAFIGECTLVSVEGIPAGGIFVGLVDAVTLTPVLPISVTGTRVDNIITIAFDMSDYEVEAGCYRLAIADYCSNTCGQFFIENPFFNCLRSGVPDWTDVGIGAGQTTNISCNLVTMCSNSDEDALAIIQSSTELCEGITYNYTIEIVSNDGYGSLEISVSNGIDTYTTPLVGTGTITGSFTPTNSGNFQIQLIAVSAPTCVEISFVQIRANQTDAVYDKYSDLISIGDYSDPCRFFKLEGCNGENQFGLSFFGSSFLPSIRLEGRRFQPQYETDADLFRYSSGRWSSTYVDRKKKVSFYFGRLPEYVFDFLSILFYFDNCYINGVLHSPVESEFPTIEYDNADDLGAFTIEMYKQNDLVKKTICIGVDADCLPSILDNDDEPFILTQDSERITTQELINLYQE
jgi:hypothetical protein